MDLVIPAALHQSCLQRGAEGTAWLAQLPHRVAAAAQAWGLRLGPAFEHGGAASWVAPVACADGSEAILKISLPHEEARYEAAALRLLDGRGVVRLLDASADGFTLLLERCRPGTDLWSVDAAASEAVACQLLPRLWQAPQASASFPSLADTVAQWWDDLPRLAATAAAPQEVVAAVVARGHALVASQPQHVLLHGDFHPGNVLAAQREPWLCIDPKPLVGEPAYDLAQWLANRVDAATQSGDPVGLLRQQITRFAGELALDPARVAGWAVVKALGWEWGPEVLTLFQRVAQAW